MQDLPGFRLKLCLLFPVIAPPFLLLTKSIESAYTALSQLISQSPERVLFPSAEILPVQKDVFCIFISVSGWAVQRTWAAQL